MVAETVVSWVDWTVALMDILMAESKAALTVAPKVASKVGLKAE